MSQNIINFIHHTKWDDLTVDVQDQAKRCLLDLIGVGIGGSQTKLAQIICDHAASDFGGDIPMLFDHRCASPLGVALAGGMVIDSLDGHDGYNPAKGHAGCGLLPALYAMAVDAGQDDGAEFLTCLVVGYELACRLAVSLHETAPDYHTSGAWVAVAVAALGARIYGLDADQTAHAMGIAEYHGPRSQMMRVIDHPTMLKDGSGWGAMAGVSAARLARAGFTGAPAITLNTDRWTDLGQNWLVMDQYFKPYPVCRWAQGPIAAVLALKAEHNLTSQDVVGIEIETFHESVRLGQKDVKNTEQAQYSTSFPCALALVHGTVTPEHVADDALNDAEVRRLSAALSMVESDKANQVFPHNRPAKARLTLRDGNIVESDWHEPNWDHCTPPTTQELVDKFHAYAGPVIGVEKSHKIHDAIMEMDTGKLQQLWPLLVL